MSQRVDVEQPEGLARRGVSLRSPGFPARLYSAFQGIPLWVWLVLWFGAALLAPTGIDVPQFHAAARGWPDPLSAVPLENPKPDAYYGIFVPWAAVLFLPLAPFPQILAAAVVKTLSLVALHYLGGRQVWKTVAICTSPAALQLLTVGNIDALSAAGLLLPGGGALLLLSLKPQAAALAAVAILRRDGWYHAIGPLVIAGLATYAWPEWLDRMAHAGGQYFNLSIFPWGLPVALVLVGLGWRRRDPVLAALATPLATPYLAFYSLAPAIALLFRGWPVLGWLGWGLMWLLFFAIW